MDSWDHFESLGCRIGEEPFFYVSILFLGSVKGMQNRGKSRNRGLFFKLIGFFSLYFDILNTVLRIEVIFNANNVYDTAIPP